MSNHGTSNIRSLFYGAYALKIISILKEIRGLAKRDERIIMESIRKKNSRDEFYSSVVNKRLADKHASILICGGGSLDREIFIDLGFTNVTVSNLDTRASPNDFSPYVWAYQDAQSLTYDDNSFDYVVIHAAIHHASMPHKVLVEMYRVAKKGLLAFEARDSILMKVVAGLKLTQEYEHAAVFYNDCLFGGVNNTEIPNYVYRWTEREVEKTIQSYSPICKHNFLYDYGTAYPCTPELELKNSYKVAILLLMRPFYQIFSTIFFKQRNQFAFFVSKASKRDDLFPWLHLDKKTNDIRFNKRWAQERYRAEKDVAELLSDNN